MLKGIISILYVFLIMCVIYDAVGNFLRTYLKYHLAVRRAYGDKKFDAYFKYKYESQIIPLFKALKQFRVLYPILLFLGPFVFNKLLGQEQISFLNNKMIEKHIWIVFLLATISFFQVNKMKLD